MKGRGANDPRRCCGETKTDVVAQCGHIPHLRTNLVMKKGETGIRTMRRCMLSNGEEGRNDDELDKARHRSDKKVKEDTRARVENDLESARLGPACRTSVASARHQIFFPRMGRL